MAAVAANFGNVLIICIPAVIAAILLVAACRASTSVVPTFVVIVSHNSSPLYASDFATRMQVRALACAAFLHRLLAIRNYKQPPPRETAKSWNDQQNPTLIGTLIEKRNNKIPCLVRG